MKRTSIRTLAAGLALAALLATPGFAAEASKADDYFNIGTIFAQNKDYDKAIDSYMQAAANDPAKYGIKANVSVAIVLGQKKEYDKAAKVLELIIDKHADYPDLYMVYKVLGRIRADQKRPADAVAAYETYLRLAPAAKLKPADRAKVEQEIASLRKQG